MTCVLYEARLALFTLLILSVQLANSYHSGAPPCRYIPGDARWPSGAKWDKLNATVGGRLIATKPLASVCHDPIYNAAMCSTLKDEWDTPLPFIQAPAEIVTALFQNQSCVPFTSISTPCTLGNYVSFSINVTGVRDAVAGLKFAKDNNIRLVIKNTGHDYLGKSTGKGGLALWMHNLKSIEIIDSYKSRNYEGPAAKLGAGVIAADAYLAVHQRGYRVVGGSCPTVGLAGGYSQGGGHSSLSGQYGLGADNVLEWEVVTADGRHLVATPTEHEELFWALSGGGGGTFAVVLSMTTRLHADGPVGGGLLVLNITQTGPEVYWDTVELFHASLPAIVDTGATVSYQITNSLFIIGAIAAPNRTAAEVTALLSPVLTSLEAKAAPFLWIPSHFETFYDWFSAAFGPLPLGIFPVGGLTASRLFPRKAVASQPKKVNDALRNTVASGTFHLACLGLNANISSASASSTSSSRPAAPPVNAVHPAWRETLMHCIVIADWDWTIPSSTMVAREAELTARVVPALEAVTPGSGTYLNEANFLQPHWQREFYGANYPRLLDVKRRLDPEGVFYARTAVGSEAWDADREGRLCRPGKKYGEDDL
ncbi:FAD binding domain protein [Drepanopeziza brunnea f. sp. 'multigermtubi' MB_m1]|uniref:FAD binding domain protein n=1 Tax=Marssonina brunnea f. sp. multigermtubi (strain MB_m1) TaxID=1072389 RepID=K1WW48_MARBU|nr:FAD binding domain protein [Drepanopeziza brunnea f. sp. 'multigermtubi' MB_m1]EKD12923.1 FAD binding domain protein [Drepanopeziza brunnea f. sp. 'multigermtubi' MB_m1]